MTTQSTDAALIDLAARCEAAKGADREIDRSIWIDVLGMCPHDHKVRSGAQSDTGFDCLLCGADSWGNLGSLGQRLGDSAPAYTRSLDAAKSLWPSEVPDLIPSDPRLAAAAALRARATGGEA